MKWEYETGASVPRAGTVAKVFKNVMFKPYPPLQATVAAFAASEGQAHPRLIRLARTEHGFGFNIAGGEGAAAPVLVSRVLPGGAAERQGGLRRGDQLITVNGRSVEGRAHGQVVHLLKEAGDEVTLLVRHAPDLLDSLERRLETARAARASGGR